jgi:hypothetical protein
MKHWFDDLTKELADGRLSRRSMLRSAFKASLAAAAAALLGRSGSAAELILPAAEGQREDGPCDVRQEGRTQVLARSTRSTFKGRPLTLDDSVRINSKQSMTSTKVIKLGGSIVIQFELVRRGNSSQVTVSYGEMIKGVRRSVFTSADGKMMQGQIDNRRIVPFRIGANPTAMKFVDRRPPPEVVADKDLQEAVQSLLAKSQREAPDCSPKRPSRAHAHHPSTAPSTALVPQEGELGHPSFPASSSGCRLCVASCLSISANCAAGTAGCAAALVFYYVCVAAVVGGCLLAMAICVGLCYAEGNECCPEGCGNACCETDEFCLNSGQGLCCSKDFTNCGGKRCCPPSATCIPSTGECCVSGLVTSNNVCCKQGQKIINDICCSAQSNVTCDGVCCQPGEQCHPVTGRCCNQPCGPNCCGETGKCANTATGLCCSFAVEVCDGKCCKPGETCLNGVCCANRCGDTCCGPNKVCCGGVCCGDNETCTNPSTKQCTPCPDKRAVGCIPQQKPGSKNVSKGGPGSGICCPPNVQCCNNQCCKPGEICCSRTGLAFGCYTPDVCVA